MADSYADDLNRGRAAVQRASRRLAGKTASELFAEGVRKMRLPNWNPNAYIELPDDGPWAHVYDVGDFHDRVLIVDCDKHNDWEPC